jgi:hypothetical protein
LPIGSDGVEKNKSIEASLKKLLIRLVDFEELIICSVVDNEMILGASSTIGVGEEEEVYDIITRLQERERERGEEEPINLRRRQLATVVS